MTSFTCKLSPVYCQGWVHTLVRACACSCLWLLACVHVLGVCVCDSWRGSLGRYVVFVWVCASGMFRRTERRIGLRDHKVHESMFVRNIWRTQTQWRRTVIPNEVAPGGSSHKAAGRVVGATQWHWGRNYRSLPLGLGSSFYPTTDIHFMY